MKLQHKKTYLAPYFSGPLCMSHLE